MTLDEPRRDIVLLVEDEDSFVDALTVGLRREGFVVVVARDGEEALARFAQTAPDLVLLDLMLPRLSGIEVCRTIRRSSEVPIIMVTAKSSEIDLVVGLEMGADDYVTKPYRLRELVARMRAVLRRAGKVTDPVKPERVICVGDLTLDTETHTVALGGEEVAMPLKEFNLLQYLMERVGRVVARETLLKAIWGYGYVSDSKTLDVHIRRIRAKIEIDHRHPRRITTIRGLGYRFEKQ